MKTRGRGVVSPSSSRLARSMVISRSGCATWIAASPMPGASYMVSNMSSASLRISGVDFLDRLGDEPQLLVRQDDDFASGHGGRFKLADLPGSMRGGSAVNAR